MKNNTSKNSIIEKILKTCYAYKTDGYKKDISTKTKDFQKVLEWQKDGFNVTIELPKHLIGFTIDYSYKLESKPNYFWKQGNKAIIFFKLDEETKRPPFPLKLEKGGLVNNITLLQNFNLEAYNSEVEELPAPLLKEWWDIYNARKPEFEEKKKEAIKKRFEAEKELSEQQAAKIKELEKRVLILENQVDFLSTKLVKSKDNSDAAKQVTKQLEDLGLIELKGGDKFDKSTFRR